MAGLSEGRDGSEFEPNLDNKVREAPCKGDFLCCQKGVKSGIRPMFSASF